MWKTIYPVSYLSTRWPFIWLGVHFQRDLYLMFRQHQRTESLLKILSNQRSQAGERVESSEWRFRSCKTPKTVEGSILSTQLYYLHLYFSFLSGSGENICKFVLCILCAQGVVFAPLLDWWLINTLSCQDQLKMNHTKLLTDTLQMERV